MAVRLVCKSVFGVAPGVRGNVLLPEDDAVIYAAGEAAREYNLHLSRLLQCH